MDTSPEVPLEQPSLPFVKNNLLWQTIEQTMDVFQRMPQNPHFHPLQNVKEGLREGIAIGHMVTFASVVEKASDLGIGDPMSIMDDLLETLAALETHGFNVRPIQDCLAKMIVVKEKNTKLQEDADVLRYQQMEHEYKLDMAEIEIEKINKEIRELQEKLTVAESVKRKEKAEMEVFEARLRDIDYLTSAASCVFQDIVSKLL